MRCDAKDAYEFTPTIFRVGFYLIAVINILANDSLGVQRSAPSSAISGLPILSAKSNRIALETVSLCAIATHLIDASKYSFVLVRNGAHIKREYPQYRIWENVKKTFAQKSESWKNQVIVAQLTAVFGRIDEVIVYVAYSRRSKKKKKQ